ncbi:MAG: tetratricopeptide repeat protein [Rhizomicrobium sp.]
MRALVFLACVCVSFAALADDPAPGGLVPGNQAKFDRAAANFDAGNYAAAYKGFRKLARNGDLAAMRNVALMERKGLGTDKDPQAALELYRYVAAAGLPTAQYDLGEMLLHGEAGDPDPKSAAKWFALAASVHHPLAQYELGKMYEEGTVLDKDVPRAEALYTEASARGVWDATVRLAALKGQPPPKPPAQPGLQPAEPVTGDKIR